MNILLYVSITMLIKRFCSGSCNKKTTQMITMYIQHRICHLEWLDWYFRYFRPQNCENQTIVQRRLFTSRFTFMSFRTRRKTGCALCSSRSFFIWKKLKGHNLYIDYCFRLQTSFRTLTFSHLIRQMCLLLVAHYIWNPNSTYRPDMFHCVRKASFSLFGW